MPNEGLLLNVFVRNSTFSYKKSCGFDEADDTKALLIFGIFKSQNTDSPLLEIILR